MTDTRCQSCGADQPGFARLLVEKQALYDNLRATGEQLERARVRAMLAEKALAQVGALVSTLEHPSSLVLDIRTTLKNYDEASQ